jgi:hypothetical protein
MLLISESHTYMKKETSRASDAGQLAAIEVAGHEQCGAIRRGYPR